MASSEEAAQRDHADDVGRFQCPSCDSTFKRLEHLRRHQFSHEELKRFECSACSKRFARSDILARHESMHLSLSRSFTSYGNDTVSSEGRIPRKRACLACAKARERCSRSYPCNRCRARSTPCVYPPGESKGVRRGQFRRETGQEMGSNLELETPAVMVEDGNNTSMQIDSGTTVQGVAAPVLDTRLQSAEPPALDHASAQGDVGLLLPKLAASHGVMVAASDAQQAAGATAQPASLSAGMQLIGDAAHPVRGYPTHEFGGDFMSSGHGVTASNQVYEIVPGGDPAYGSRQQPVLHGYDPTLDLPINWLSPNLGLDLDYVSILGLGLGSTALYGDTDSIAPEESLPLTQRDRPIGLPTRAQDSMVEVEQRSNSGLAISSSQSVSTASHASLSPIPQTLAQGGLYATSTNGARVPCTVRFKRNHITIPGTRSLAPMTRILEVSEELQTLTALPNQSHVAVAHLIPEGHSVRHIHSATYEQIKHNLRYLYPGEDAILPGYHEPHLPSLDQLNFFVHLYFEQFNPILPILHERLVDLNGHWLLSLAVATIGSQYTLTEEFSMLVGPLHELLHRALVQELEHSSDEHKSLALAQATFLSQIGMLYHGSPKLCQRAKGRHSAVVELLRSGGLLRPSLRRDLLLLSDLDIEQQWKEWVHDEARRRLGYSIWLLDCMMAFHFGQHTLLSLADAEASLPQDILWEAATSREWHSLLGRHQENPNLVSAVQHLFLEKTVKPDLGEFSRIILLHGVYQEIWQVKRYFDRPLATWMPSAQAAARNEEPWPSTNSSNIVGGEKLHEGSTAKAPTFSSWRNAACDCVDVLHWAANGMIARLSGAEHTTVFHLHFARVVLLTPIDDIQILAQYCASLTGYQSKPQQPPSRQQGLAAERRVIEWAQQDEHKARLAVLHCGCFFWHIRRYGAMAFYEPVSIYMATLAVWAYSSYVSRAAGSNGQTNRSTYHDGSRSGSTSRQQTPETGPRSSSLDTSSPESPMFTNYRQGNFSPESEEEPIPTFIRLDRPNDDEMVQLFVRNGRPSVMRAYMTGVGDICSPKGPVRILREGIKILSNASMAWGRTKKYISLLEAVERATLDVSGRND